MAKILTDAEIGLGAPAASAPAVLSDADIGLGAAPPRRPTPSPGASAPVAAPPVKTPKSATTPEEARSIGDMVLGLPAFNGHMGIKGALELGAAVSGVENPATWATQVMGEALEGGPTLGDATSFGPVGTAKKLAERIYGQPSPSQDIGLNKLLVAPMATLARDTGEHTLLAKFSEKLADVANKGAKSDEERALRGDALNVAMMVLPAAISRARSHIKERPKQESGMPPEEDIINDFKAADRQAAARDVKADVEAVTGVKTAQERAKTTAARQKDVKQAFKDTDTADYYQFKADEAASNRDFFRQQREAAELRQQYPMAPETRADFPVEKLAAASRTAEHLRTPDQQVIFDQYMKSMQGKADPKLLAAIAGGGIGGLLAMNYDGSFRDEVAPWLVGAAGMVSPAGVGRKLRGALEEGGYTTKTFDRLPDKESYSKEEIQNQLKRQDVSGQEREIIQRVLDSVEGDKISAKDLAQKFAGETSALHLESENVGDYASYGIADMESAAGRPARTTLWKMPEELAIDQTNHFENPRYYGHTRSIDMGEASPIRHIVEVQSDMAGSKKSEINAEQREALETKLEELNDRWQELHDRPDNDGGKYKSEFERITAEHAEIKKKLDAREEAHPDVEASLKHYQRRLVNHELAQAAREGMPAVRFANADAVAKIEGWDLNNKGHRDLYNKYKDLEKYLKTLGGKEIAPEKSNEWYNRTGKENEAAVMAELEGVAMERAGLRYRRDISGQKIDETRLEHLDKRFDELTAELRDTEARHPHRAYGWIEVPTKPFAGPTKMFGKADPRLLAGVAGAGVGMALSDDNKLLGGLLGSVIGLGGASYAMRRGEKILTPEQMKTEARKVYDTQGEAAAARFVQDQANLKTGRAAEKEVSQIIGQSLDNVTAQQRIVHNQTDRILKAVPDPAAREAITRAMDTGTVDQLPAPLKKHAVQLRELFDRIGVRAQEAGVIDGMRENYITHIVDWKASGVSPTGGIFEGLMEKISGERRGTSSGYGRQRKHATFEDLQKAIADSGLKIRTMDSAEIYKTYAESMERAIQHRNIINWLKAAKDTNGEPMIRQLTKDKAAPRGWQTVNSPSLRGYAVSPDIAPMVKHVFDQGDPSALLQGVHNMSQLVKRINVAGSLFHAMSLVQASWAALGPLRTVKDLALSATDKAFGRQDSGITKALKQFKEGGLGDEIDSLIRQGLMVTPPEDVTRGLLGAMGKTADDLAAKIGIKLPAEKVGTGIEKYTLGALDKFTWDFLHTGLKINTALALIEKAKVQNPNIPIEKIRQNVASFVNNSFGGLNWFRTAAEANSKWARDLQLGLYSKNGRLLMQTLLFAPDWTLSTLKAFGSAFGEGTGTKGIKNPSTQADFARRYLLRVAGTYATLVNTANMATAGRPIWENDDPTRIEFKDGTSMQPMKHAAEPIHWITDPGKQLQNKLGFVPKVMQEFAPAYQKGGEPGTPGERAARVAGMVLPFSIGTSAQAPEGEKLQRAAMGTIGLPMYGKPKTPAQMREARDRKREKERKKRREQR